MKGLVDDFGWMIAALAAIGSVYTVAAAIFVGRFFKHPRRGKVSDCRAPWASVTIVKPLHGAEPGLRENLKSFLRQDAPVSLEVVFGAHHASDPALRIAEALIAESTISEARICLDGAEYGHNRKVSNIINISDQANGDVLVLSDSDIGAPADYLVRVLECLAEPGVGVVTCPYIGKGEGGFWSKFAAMGLSYSFLPNVVTGVRLGMAQPCMGSTVALRRETLEQIGGFRVFRDALADDYAIGVAVRRLGLKSVVAPVLVSHSCNEPDLRTIFAHELRWAKTVRGVDPAGHLGSVITHPLPLALLAAAILGVSPTTAILTAIALLVRIALTNAVDDVAGRKLNPWWLIPARDLVSFGVFLASFLVREVEWRGTKFHVTPDGELLPL